MPRNGTDPKAPNEVPVRASQAELAPTAHMPAVAPPPDIDAGIAARPTVYAPVAPMPMQTPAPFPRPEPAAPILPTTFSQPQAYSQPHYVGPIPAMRTGMGPMQPAAIVPRAGTQSGRRVGWLAILIVVVIGAGAGVLAATRLLARAAAPAAAKP